MMADKDTQVPSVEATPTSIVEKQAEKPEPNESTASQTETDPANSAPPAKAASANSVKASIEPLKETSTASGEEEKSKVPADEETKESTAAAAPTDASAASEQAVRTKTTFEEFDTKLPEILKEVGHDEMWGVKLVSPASSHIPTGIVLQKFLNANDGDLTTAIEQFSGALKFRQAKKPLDLVAKTFNAHKFADLGAVTTYDIKGSPVPEVFTWNLYGNVKGKMDEVFVPLDEFVHQMPLRPLYMCFEN